MYNLQKINDHKIKVHKKTNVNETIKGSDLIPIKNSITFVCGRKFSGKTMIINDIIHSMIDKDTTVIVFAATHNSDQAWIDIKKYLNDKNINKMFYTGIVENGENNLDNLIKYFQNESADIQEAKLQETDKTDTSALIQIVKFDNKAKSIKIKIKKKKQITPKYLVIFDDISIELKNKDVAFLLKTLRHYGCQVVISSQYPNDLDKQSRCQIDIWMLFKGFEKLKMEEIFPQLDLTNIEFDNFYKIYQDVTKELHQFLYINRINNEMRKNFNMKINY